MSKMNPAELQLSSSTESDTEYVARPWIKSIVVPESVKRRLPSKHYVYKVVVMWTDNKKIIIYRKYSLFFDFVFKLNELVSKLPSSESKKSLQLPELPGRILFGRSEVHHVAEKRRKKIEDFCQKLIELPQEISQSPLVLGFFNTWPDDTMLRKPSVRNTHLISSPFILEESLISRSPSSSSSQFPFPTSINSSGSTSSTSSKSVSSPPPPLRYEFMDPSSTRTPSPPPPPPPATAASLDSSLDAIISHPDEMEHLEQYRVLSNYERKDSHQVSLMANQLVHVIEKHDTGWWMVMSEDEQGYAPASYLDPVEENSLGTDIHPEDDTNQVYEAMESYFADNEDEITIKAGDSVEVISKSMDGWWKIRCNGHVGYSPAALIRRRMSIRPDVVGEEIIYESEKSIYEGLNIHRPPPRRNTVDRSNLKILPHYNTPRSVSAMHEANNIYIDPGEGESDEESPKRYQITKNNNINTAATTTTTTTTTTATTTATTNKKSIIKQKSGGLISGGGSSSVDFDDSNDHIYEYDPSPIYEDTELEASGGDTNGSIYENTDFSPQQENFNSPLKVVEKSSSISSPPPSSSSSSSSPPPPPPPSSSSPSSLLKKHPIAVMTKSVPTKQPVKGKRLSTHTPDDYEDPDALLKEERVGVEDYMVMDGIDDHNTYIDPDDLRRVNGGVNSNATGNSTNSSESSVPDLSSGSPDLRSKNKTPGGKIDTPSRGKVRVMEEPMFDDDYIEMDPVYTEPPLEEDNEDNVDSDSNTDTLKADKTPPKGSPVTRYPLPPPPYRGNSPSQEISLTRGKSVENLIASLSTLSNNEQSLKLGLKKAPPPPPPRIPAPLSRLASSPSLDMSKVIKQRTVQNQIMPNLRNGNETTSPTSPLNFASRSHGSLSSHQLLERNMSPTDTTDNGSAVTTSHGAVTTSHGRDLQNNHPTTTKKAPSSSSFSSSSSSSPPSLPKSEGLVPKTYVSMSNYVSQTEGCLSFSAGDKCVLIQQNKEGWWLVNIGGQEGWTPGEYWKEDIKRDIRPPKPPSFAPQKLVGVRKPRSHTVGIDSFASTQELLSNANRTKDDLSPLTNGDSNNVKLGNNPIPPRKTKGPVPKPPPKNKPAKPPKPALSARPELPARPDKFKNSVLNNSPPSGRKNNSGHSPSPPPVPPAKPKKPENIETSSLGNEIDGDHNSIAINDYEQLDECTTGLSIENSPWFVGKMERGQAEQFLMDYARQREFLIRERSTKDGYYALSIRYHYNCKHFNIDPSPDGQYIMGVLTFPSIDDVIRHYQQNSLFVHEGQHVTLSQPVKKKHRPSDANRPHS